MRGLNFLQGLAIKRAIGLTDDGLHLSIGQNRRQRMEQNGLVCEPLVGLGDIPASAAALTGGGDDRGYFNFGHVGLNFRNF